VPTLEERSRSIAVQEAEAIVPSDPPEYQERQRRTMVVALCLLLVALGVVIVRDRDFWFPPSSDTQADATDPDTDSPVQDQIPSTPKTRTVQKARKKVIAPPKQQQAVASTEPIVTTQRRALPPLQVEVVAGDVRRTIHPGTSSVRIDLSAKTPPRPVTEQPVVQSAASNAPTVNASEKVSLSPETAQAVIRPVNPDYPLLARQMKVQGSVILEALIGRDGSIQDLRVISGPAILAAAAREAVRQWRFKPYLQDGQAVDTQARIVVNFTISTT
jgi:TonB family protein